MVDVFGSEGINAVIGSSTRTAGDFGSYIGPDKAQKAFWLILSGDNEPRIEDAAESYDDAIMRIREMGDRGRGLRVTKNPLIIMNDSALFGSVCFSDIQGAERTPAESEQG